MLAGLRELLQDAEKKGCAVAAFNTPTYEALLAVIGAAEVTQTPIIIAHAEVHEKVARLVDIGPVMIHFAKRATVPVCVHLDHSTNEAYCQKAMDIGFTSIMYDCSMHSYAENLRMTIPMAEYAHSRGVDIESELGQIPYNNVEGIGYMKDDESAYYTNADLAAEFVEETRTDALAIAFGTAHGEYARKPMINTDIITKVREKTHLPLVMHGGSGLSDEQYREAIRCGIRKINYHTYLSFEGYQAAVLLTEEENKGYFHDIAVVAQRAMFRKAESVIRTFSLQTATARITDTV